MSRGANATVRRFLDRTPVAAALVAPDMTVLAVNARMEDLLEYGPGDLEGRDSLALVHPDDVDRAATDVAEGLAGRRPRGVHDNYRVLRGDGAWMDVELSITNLSDDPVMAGFLLTARVPATADRRVAWFEAVVGHMADVVVVLDGDGRILFAGPGIGRLIGHTAETVVGKLLADVVRPEQVTLVRRWLDGLLARPGPHPPITGLVQGVDDDGLHIEVRATNLLGDPFVEGIVLVARDVTSQHRVMADARLAARLVEASPIVVVATDAEGRITAWNPAAERALGWTTDDAVGQTFRSLGGHTADSLAKVYDDLDVLLAGGTIDFEAEVATRDGTTRPAYLVFSGLLDDDGAFAGFLALGVDLSEQERSAQALARAEGRWSALARRARELVAICDEKAITIYAGPGFTSILGYEPDTLVGTPIRALLHPDDRNRPGGLEEVLAGEATGYQRDYRVRHADGTWRVIEVEVSDQRDERFVGGFVVVGRDVTQRVAVEAANRHLAAAIESTGAAVIVLGLDRRVVGWNRGAELLLGWPAEEAVGSTPPVVPHGDADELGDVGQFDAVALRKDGTTVHLSVNGSPVHDAEGAVVASTWVAFDVTARRSADREREARAAQQAVIAAVTGRALGGAPIDDVLDEACRLAASTLGAASVMTDLHEPPPVEAPPDGTVACAIEGWDGVVGTLTAVAAPDRPLGDGDIAFLHALASVLGTIVDRSRVTEEMRRRALHDDLTDLPNRTLVVDRLAQAIGRSDRRGEQLAVLFVDLDRFKRVNDTLGHAAGDAVLVETARRLIDAVRAGDTVARVGGDEFVVLCEDIADRGEGTVLASRIVDAVAEPIVVHGMEVVVTASVGVVVAAEVADADALVRDADLAMYRAKQLGRARVEVFDTAMRDAAITRMGIEQALREAVLEERLHVVYQPQVDLADGSVVGIEALVRWDDPDFGPVEPSALVGVADEIGLLDQISWFVLHEACATAVRVRETRPDVAVSVNLGARQLCHTSLVARVGAALERTGLPPEGLVIEVVETDVVDEAASKVLATLREQGVRVSLDDFGTGWSSLHRLTRLPVDEVKVDRSFVSGVGHDRGCDAVIRAVASLAEELGLRLVAEGVERADQRDRLVALGCRVGQGWLLGGPVEADELRL